MSGAVPVTRISELVLEASDLERSVAFYRDVLGFTVFRESDERAWLLAAGNTRIGLWTPELGPGIAGGLGGAHVHFAFHLADPDFDAAVGHLESKGCAVEIHDFRDEARGRNVYVSDPDGNVVEFSTLDVSAATELAS